MKKELEIVNAEDFGIEKKKGVELMGNLPQITSERELLSKNYEEIILLDIEDPKTSASARELRLKIRDNRTKGIEVWHKNAKSFFLKGGQFVDAIKNKEIAVNQRMESNLEEIEKHFENLEKKRIAEIQESRLKLILPYVEDADGVNLGKMEADVWDAYLTAKKKNYEDRIEAERLAEVERVKKEKEAEEERVKQLAENERLRKEAEVREVEIAKEREEKKRIEDELNRKKEAEILAEKQLKEAEGKLKKEAEKLAKAPIKKQLNVWVDSFSIQELNVTHEKKELIKSKFEAFKQWAKKEIEEI